MKIGDPVTCFVYALVRPVRAIVAHCFKDGDLYAVKWNSGSQDQPELLKKEDEGRVWLRGHGDDIDRALDSAWRLAG